MEEKKEGARDTPGKGCGIWPLIFRGWPSQQCEVHDQFYIEGSWAQNNISRKRADDHFLEMLLEKSGNNFAKRAASYAMYGVVRVFGGWWWEGKK